MMCRGPSEWKQSTDAARPALSGLHAGRRVRMSRVVQSLPSEAGNLRFSGGIQLTTLAGHAIVEGYREGLTVAARGTWWRIGALLGVVAFAGAGCATLTGPLTNLLNTVAGTAVGVTQKAADTVAEVLNADTSKNATAQPASSGGLKKILGRGGAPKPMKRPRGVAKTIQSGAKPRAKSQRVENQPSQYFRSHSPWIQ